MARAIAPCRLLASSWSRPSIPTASSARPLLRRCLQQHARVTSPEYAFAFDIDGVLVRSSEPLPRAKKALTFLQQRHVPFILLTNGGGKHEAARVADLSERLEVPLDPHMFVQSHTPFATMVHGDGKSPGLKDECILVVGGEGDRCRQVAESYGFTNVITPSDIYTACPEVWPFSSPFAAYHRAHARALPLPIHSSSAPPTSSASALRIAAVFVYNDPRDWGLDAALLADIMLSHQGILGTRSPLNGRTDLPNRGYLQDGQPTLYWSNPDLWFAAQWHLPRLGAGGFKAAFEGLWREVSGGADLPVRVGGKPHRETFAFAERRLVDARKGSCRELQSVYMVGDNPASDILGANSYRSPFGISWTSILVRSGVWADEAIPSAAYQPTGTVSDVWDAVRWALDREGVSAD